jgi:hypothetical protein
MDSFRPVIHIGYQKTGSTWLRKLMFDHSELGFSLPIPDSELVRALCTPDALDFDPDACREVLVPRLKAAADQGLMPVISQMGICGNAHYDSIRAKEWAERVKTIFPTARVLIVIREQKSFIQSLYKHDIVRCAATSLEEYLEPTPGNKRLLPFRASHFAYDRLIACYQSLFPKEDVQVFPYEHFRREPKEFIGELCRSWGVEPPAELPYSKEMNRSISAWGAGLRCRMNRVWMGEIRPKPKSVRARVEWLMRGIDTRISPSKRKLEEERLAKRIAAWVGDRYRESNRRVEAMTGLDLGKWGYDV